jgi:uncharacterized protein
MTHLLRCFLLPAALWCSASLHAQAAAPVKLTPLHIGGANVAAEIVSTPADRQQGLMFRQSMPADQGMLFVFEHTAMHCFWMRNTPLPLTIGFFDDKGILLNILDMKPFDESSHCPAKPAKYALEMNLGWFAKNKLKAGIKMTGQPKPLAP